MQTRPHLEDHWSPGEVQPGTPVTVDGKVAGNVRTVGASGEVEFVITNRLLAQTLRRGTVHVRERGRIVLDTSAADPAGALLRTGDVVPTQSKVAHIARQWSMSAVLLMGLAAVVLAICIVKLLLFKLAGPLVPFIVAMLLTGFTAWILSPPLAPVIDRCYSKFAAQADSSAAAQSADASAGTLARWQSRVVGSLGTRPNPHLISFVLIGVAVLPLWLWFICRMRSICHATSAIVPAILLASTTAFADTKVGLSRSELQLEQRGFQSELDSARTELDGARRLLAAGAFDPAERRLLKTQIHLDVFELAVAGHEERAQALRPSPLSYNREGQVKIFLANARQLRSEKALLEQDFAALILLQKEITNSWHGLALYREKRAQMCRQFQVKSLSPAELIRDLERLQGFPTPLIVSRMISGTTTGWEKTARNTWRSPSGVEFREDGTAVPQPQLTNTIVRVVTNTVRIPTPTPPPGKVVEYVTNVQRVFVDRPITNVERVYVDRHVTNTLFAKVETRHTSPPAQLTNSPSLGMSEASMPTTTKVRSEPPTAAPRSIVPLYALAGTGVAALIGLALVGVDPIDRQARPAPARFRHDRSGFFVARTFRVWRKLEERK